jgi:hypothetical protein
MLEKKNYKKNKSGATLSSIMGGGINYHARHFYTMLDDEYRQTIISVLTKLEPIFERNSTVLVSELDEFNIITFITTGKVGIGYEINKYKKI